MNCTQIHYTSQKYPSDVLTLDIKNSDGRTCEWLARTRVHGYEEGIAVLEWRDQTHREIFWREWLTLSGRIG
jgi:hypothetical protein